MTKYTVCFVVASLITLAVFGMKGFFTHSTAVNIQILSDGFTVSGILLTLFAGMLFISGQGALIGVKFVLRNVALAFIPMGRKKHMLYAQYREHELSRIKKESDHCILLTGLLFLFVGVIFALIWNLNFYNTSV